MQKVVGAAVLPQAEMNSASEDAGLWGFFSHHGVWAPGVRLFRRMRFMSKAWLISLVFLVPITVLATFYFRNLAADLSVVRAEIQGVQAIGPINVLRDLVQKQRRAVMSGKMARADLAPLDQALADLKQAMAQADGLFDTDKVLQHVQQAHADLARLPQDAEFLVAERAFVAYSDALDEMNTDILDGSTLSLDPEVDTYYLMLAGTDLAAQVNEALSHLRALAGALTAQGLSDPDIQRRMYALWDFASRHNVEIDKAVNRAATVDAGLPTQLKLAERLKAVETFLAVARTDWVGSNFQPQTAQTEAVGQVAVDGLRQLRNEVQAELGRRLALREAALVAQRSRVVVLLVVSLAVAGYLFYCFALVMYGGLREVRRHLKAMTAGDLTTSPSPWGQDEAARLMVTLAEMQQSLRGIVLQVRTGSDHIVHSSSEIASGALDLSSRTEQTASNLEESAASMEQISATVRTTADHARQAADIARSNAQVAQRGGEVMSSMVSTMDEIHRSSSKISDIIGVIDGIAFQTNILALNAAVEAARAGDAGRGFAVVASEVRSLAQRSAGAAREIKSLITDSVDRIEAGTGVARSAGQTIGEIVEGAQRINQLLDEIATGAKEQSQGVSQVGTAVQDLDRLTQQNAALVEQTAAAADILKDRAIALSGEVGRFQLPAGMVAVEPDEGAIPVADFDFDAAISAHREWKVKLRGAIAAHGQLDADKVCQDNQCPLGKWLHGPGGATWGGKPSFVALVDKHAEFHRTAGEVARRINAGDYEFAERLIGSGSQFATVSSEVSTLLTRAKRGL